MGDLHYQYLKARGIVIAYKGGPSKPYIKLKKHVLVARYALIGFSFALAETFAGFDHYHPLVSAAHPDSSFLLIGENLGGTLA